MYVITEDDNTSESEDVYDNIYDPSDYDTLADLD